MRLQLSAAQIPTDKSYRPLIDTEEHDDEPHRPIDKSNANEEQKALLDAIQGQLGMVPNFVKIFANCGAVNKNQI